MAEITGGCAAGWEECFRCPQGLDREKLEQFGERLDQRPARLRGKTVGMAVAEQILLVRTREGRTAPLRYSGLQVMARADN